MLQPESRNEYIYHRLYKMGLDEADVDAVAKMPTMVFDNGFVYTYENF